jgi:hypothetical protein
MKIVTLVTSFILILAGFFFPGTGSANFAYCLFWENDGTQDVSTIIEDCSEYHVTGHSRGNHELDCTVIRPWNEGDGPDPGNVQYPVIAWANGWDQGEVNGAHTTEGYKPGLIEWALDGPYIVVAANQWSVQESDVLACVQWIIDQNGTADSEYEDVVNEGKIGLAGHSQGGGAVIKAGDGESNGFYITTVIAMNPYGPGWVNPGNQDGPMLLLGGANDTTTPTDSFLEVWQAIQSNDQGGLLAELDEFHAGTHNSEAWGSTFDEDDNETTMGWDDAREVNFGKYQRVTELWWDIHLNGNARRERQLQRLFDRDPSWKLW